MRVFLTTSLLLIAAVLCGLVPDEPLASELPSIRLVEDLVLGNDTDQLIGVVTDVVVDSKGFIYVGDLGFQHI